MKIVNTGTIYHLYDDNSLKTYDLLPAQTYRVNFSKMTGFFLENYPMVEVNEKIYGVHTKKVDKVFKSFLAFERHMGVILSGEKGIGKSLFAKLLSIKAIKNNYPLIIVDTYYPGIADFLTRINQEVFILFDEFEKVFAKTSDYDPQTELLTLFDGISTGKKCFIITCNQLHNLNDYLVNRPGRFHYHFRFDYPTIDEVKEYLKDKLKPDYYVAEIDNIIEFVHKVKLNYDCLRAIAFELNLGVSFNEAINDINILKLEPKYSTITAVFKNGKRVTQQDCQIDLFSEEDCHIGFYNRSTNIGFVATLVPTNAIYNYDLRAFIIDGNDVVMMSDEYDENDNRKSAADIGYELDYIVIKEINESTSMRYLV